MKLNKKLIIPAFALLAGASLVGSVSGTIAWYQYSTRVNASYIGSSAGTIGNLQIRINDGTDRDWGTRVSTDDVLNYLSLNNFGQEVEPVTSGNLGKNDSLKKTAWDAGVDVAHGDTLPDVASANDGDLFLLVEEDNTDPENIVITRTLKKFNAEANEWQNESIPLAAANPANPDAFDADYQFINYGTFKLHGKEIGNAKDFYRNPSYGYGAYKYWRKADSNKHYVKIPLQLRFIGEDEDDLQAKEVYLSKLLIQKDTLLDEDAANHGDLSDAIRVHFSAYEDGDELHAKNHLVSKNGGTTATHGNLKLGRGDDFDQAYDDDDEWGFGGSQIHYVEYGEGVQNSYGAVIKEAPNETYYDDDHNYYEKDEIPEDADGWKELAVFGHGENEPNLNDGAEGDLYIRETNSGADRELYKKEAGEWQEDATVLTGTVDPNTDGSLNQNLYYLKTNDNKLYAYDDGESLWKLVDDVLVEDNNDAVAEDYDIGKLRVNSEENKLYKRIPGVWTLIASELLEDAPEIAAEGDFVVGNLYIDPDTNKLYEYEGGIYVEKISPILVSEKVDENNVLKIGDTDADKVIGKTVVSREQGDTNPQKYLNVDVTIWVEGWHKFENASDKYTSIWNKKLIGAWFDVGMQFAVQDLNAD